MVGKTIGHYRLIAPLGSGGMGEVYLAHDNVLGRKVALKLLPSYFIKDTERLRRFEQEARAASALNHPNIVTIHEIGHEGPFHFIAQEFVDGVTLGKYRGSKVGLTEVLEIAMQVASALSAAHAKGIVHRDIKPENIMVEKGNHLGRQNHVKVLDFGIAKLADLPAAAMQTDAMTRLLVKTGEGKAIGTAAYMSPEQARGETVDARTDIWSLGVVLYEMLTGKQPFVGETSQDVIASILRDDFSPLPAELPDNVKWMLKKALRKEAGDRYQTARELFSDLRDQAVTAGSEQNAAVTARVAAVKTRDGADASSKSSAAYIVKGIKLPKRGAHLILAALVAAIIAGAYFAYSRYWAEGGKANIDSTVGIRSVAVLPFANKSNDPNMEYLSDGISQSLINSLSQLPGVKVIASSSSFKYKGHEVDPQEMARALGVEGILTGRVAQLGENLLISVELMKARDRTQVWGEQYNRKATDLLAVQSDISREIAGTLRLHLTASQQQQLTKRESVNPQAYELLLKGRFSWRKQGLENQKKAIEYYQQAIAADPTYALAYAELSAGYSVLYGSGIIDPKEFRPKSQAAAYKALELDESLADAHYALASLKQSAWEWAAAEREYQRAIELNPNLAEAHLFYSSYLMVRGRHDEAIAEAKRARDLDPLSLWKSAHVGFVLTVARRHDEAIESVRKTLEMDQNFAAAHGVLAGAYAGKGMYREAIAESLEAIKLGGDSPTHQIYLGKLYAQAGERAKALEMLKRLQTSKEYVSPAELVVLYAALGEREQAFASLDKAYAAHDLQLQYLGVDDSFDSIRSDPRFQDLMRRVGLTP